MNSLRNLLRLAFSVGLAIIGLVTFFNWSPPLVQSAGQIKYVDQGAAGVGSGDSWVDAYTDLQTALANVTAGDQIWVASGVYTPGVTISDTFQLVDDVAIYGGFDATEVNLTERDWRANITVLSGDIGGDDTADSDGIVQSIHHIVGPNSLHIVTALELGQTTATVDGFVITGGYAQGAYPSSTGAGMYLFLSRPTISNVSFIGNYASQWGGGLYNNKESHSTLNNLEFYGNYAQQGGGGVFNLFSNPKMVNSTFGGNESRIGGGMYNYSSQLTLSNVTFNGNFATNKGAGLYNDASSTFTMPSANRHINTDPNS